LISGVHLVTDLYAAFVIGLIPVLTLKFDLSIFMVAILTSVNQIANSLTQPIFAYFADKKYAKYYLMAGPLFASIFISLIGISPSYYLILFLLFFGNLSISAYHPPSASFGGLFGGSKRGLSNSIISFGGNLGYALGALYVIFIVEKLGIEYTPLAMIPGIIAAFLVLRFVPDSINRRHATFQKINIFAKLKYIKKQKMLLLSIIWFSSFSRDLMWISLVTFVPIYFTRENITLMNLGYVLLAFGLMGGMGGLLAGFLSNKIKKPYILQAGFLISLPFIYLTFTTSGFLSIVFFILTGFFLLSTLPLCINLSQDIFPSNMGLASSLVMGLSTGMAGITMIGVGKIADSVGIETTIFFLLILPVTASLLLFGFKSYGKEYC
jgi:MFS transporter, FSR family, fosmidomycin resistance protein